MDYGGGDMKQQPGTGCLAARLARVCWLSLQPTACTSALALRRNIVTFF